jgi:polyketide synthase PksN
VVEGWGVNQDGKTNGITAPNPESQTRLMQNVYDKYRIEPANIQLVEAHGTGTKLGDPIEVEGLKATFRKYVQSSHTCALGSVKSNIGHCLTAAGIAGVIKLLLALQHKQLPPTVNFEQLNEHIDLTGSPFYINTRLRPWEVEGTARRQAAISSFGFSGTNAHVVIGEAAASVADARATAVLVPGAKVIAPLSARTPEQLQQKAEDLLAFLRGEGREVVLHDLAYTLQVGRTAMDERLGFVVGSVGELTEKLEAWVRGDRAIGDVHQGQVKRSNDALSLFSVDADLQETVARWIAKQRLSRLVELWVKGLELDWGKLYGEVRPRRISLPLYPFARERYWIDAAAEQTTTVKKAVVRGNFRAQLRGLALRRETAATLLVAPSWVPGDAQAGPFEYAEHHVIACELPNVDSAELQSLLPQSRCLSLQGNEENIAQRYSAHAMACFERLQAILKSKPQGDVLLQMAVAGDGDRALFAGLSALLKTAALENPRLTGQFLLLPPDTTAAQLAERLQNEKRRGNDPLVRFEGGARQVLRWQEVAAAPDARPAFRDHGVYLITGGMGGLGLIFAREILMRAPQARVVLTGRGPLTAEKQALLDGLSARGRASYRQLDLGDLAQVERLIAAIVDEHQRLDGILHCAGTTADAIIVKKSAPELAAVLAPKVIGAYHLDQASRGVQLDVFVLFSSVAGALGNAGQADYAAANAFLDHFAAHRNRQVAAGERHGRTRSINWPLWQEGRMAIDAATRELLRQTIGVEPLQTAAGLESFHRALALPYDQTLVMAGDTARIAAYLQQAGLFAGAAMEETRGIVEAVSLTELQQRLKTLLAAVLRIDAASIDADQPFIDLGLDSFLGAELIVAINKAFGTTLSHMRLFDYSSVSQFALFLEKELAAMPAPAGKSAPARTRSMPAVGSYPTLTRKGRRGRRTADRVPSDGRIAIIGMSGRYPQAGDLRRYWENLTEGRNSISEVPRSRWDVERYYDPVRGKKDKTYSKWLGAIDDFDCFDPLFFRISPQEAEFMDPQHRLFLEESYRAFEDAGYAVSELSNRKCGVYLGISTNEYMSLLSRHGVLSAPVTSNSGAIAAARIAYYLNLKGPAISVDTACSSSLVAVHLASQAILNGEIDMALAGGVSLWLTADSYVAMSQAGMFSPSGQCKTFDDSADGIVNGEGVGAVVLKRLRDAERDGDAIYGVILGSAINQDGRTNGITAPSVNSQIELERGLYARHGIDPETINYVETHGTGTRLGDPIELEALSTVFSEKTTKKNFCALGSVKSNIGHTTSASGVAGLQKVLLSIRHRTLVPTLNVTEETSRFDFRSSPFYVSRETKPWEAAPGSLRRAAVSSFGFSGTNAHLVVEEYPSPAPVAPRHGQPAFIIPLSARTADQLRQKARDLLALLRTEQRTEQPVDLAAVAYTLQVGREAMEERLGFLVTSVDELAEKLAAFAGGEKNIDGMHRGRVEPGRDDLAIIGHDDDMQEAIEKWIARKKLSKLLELWIRGLSFDWSKLHGDDKPRRVSLPVYPFARERYWFQATPAAQPQLAGECRLASDADIRSIEEIITQIADDAVETGSAVETLKIMARPPHRLPPATSADLRTKASS